MLIIRGLKPHRKWIGYTIAWCPIRRDLALFRVLRCGRVRHLYFIHVAKTQWSHYELVCPETAITLWRRGGDPPELLRQTPVAGAELAPLAPDDAVSLALRHAERDQTQNDRSPAERVQEILYLLQEADRGITRPPTRFHLQGTALTIGVAGLLIAVALGATRSWLAIPIGVGAGAVLAVVLGFELRESAPARFRRMRTALCDAIRRTGAANSEIADAVKHARAQRMRVAPHVARAMRRGAHTD